MCAVYVVVEAIALCCMFCPPCCVLINALNYVIYLRRSIDRVLGRLGVDNGTTPSF